MNATESTAGPVTRLYTIRDAKGVIVAIIRAQSPAGALSYHAAATLAVSRSTPEDAFEAARAGISATNASAQSEAAQAATRG